MNDERRGLRFQFSADAEIASGSAPSVFVPARVKELSFRGCFLETSAPDQVQSPVLLKIYKSGELFEAEVDILYIKPTGIGLLFCEIKPHFRAVLQGWILTELDKKSQAHTLAANE
jgi:PilZ domain